VGTKKATQKLTKEQRKLQDDIKRRAEALQAKQTDISKETEELFKLRRNALMQNVSRFGFSKEELDAFVSALDGFKQNHDLAVALINAAKSSGKVDMQQFEAKLIRLGFV